jgi:lysophospholipase L1-like esterase
MQRWSRRGVCSVALGLSLVAGCPPQSADSARTAPVILNATELLEPPAVGGENHVFRPAHRVPLVAASPLSGQAAGFYVSLAAADADSLALRLIDRDTKTVTLLQRVTAPASAEEQAAATPPAPFSATVSALLAKPQPVFWVDSTGPGRLDVRVAVLIPEALLTASTRLEMYTRTTSAGAPLAAAQLELVRDFFYLTVLGDSVTWGNGLQEKDKMTTHMIADIEQATGRRVINQRYAQTGANIVPEPDDGVCAVSCFGEAPAVNMSITTQVGQIRRPELLELVFLNGCINDVGLTTILNPDTTDEQLTGLTQHFCGTEMATLLRKIRDLAPQARIVVAGYYPIVGPDSDIFALRTWESTRGENSTIADSPFLAQLVAHSDLFYTLANASLRGAIAQLNAEAGGTLVAFADPQFGSQNAVFAPQKLLWSMTSENRLSADINVSLALFPEDDMLTARAEGCVGIEDVFDFVTCIYDSVGHPNPAGARVFATAIAQELRNLGILPTSAP